MAETDTMSDIRSKAKPEMRPVYRGRIKQIGIYLGKFSRMFITQNGWFVIPMSAAIAGIVSYVVRTNFFLNMEGTIMGSLALTCACLWNGAFNSIQVICRESFL